MKVANRKIIRKLSFRSMQAAGSKNVIAVTAIALTTLLFTALLTIVMSITYSFEQSNFRQAGGYNHGTFKYLTKEQFDELKNDTLIKEYGLRRFVGMPDQEPFQKAHVEVSFCDENVAKWMFLSPVEGHFPTENTNEAATDTRVLELLGIEPQLGAEFTMTFMVDGVETTQTFALCGWWDYDEAITASHVLIPLSRAEQLFAELNIQGNDGMTGTYNMDVMLKSPAHIEADLHTILERHGYQSESRQEGDNYIATSVNWGYVTAQLSDSMDAGTVLALVAAVLLIIFTGYLIIYNVFQISVSNDIRSYGLLKTIGTTGRQIHRMVLIQSLLLSAVGIPIGLVCGYGVGAVLTPIVLKNLDGVRTSDLSMNPLIFAGSALFALITVLISCRKPSKIASKVSPIEALRYTEGDSVKGRQRKAKKGVLLFQMAVANLGRNRKKTVVTMLSLALAVVMLQMTVVFTNGFDMDKYLKNMVVDFIVADASYIQTGVGLYSATNDLPENVIDEIIQKDGIKAGGRTYGDILNDGVFTTEEDYRQHMGRWMSQKELDANIARIEKNQDMLLAGVDLYGMEPFCLDRLRVVAGDLAKLNQEGKYIAAVYYDDDYGNVEPDSHWAKVGDTVKIRYTEEYEYFNPQTGEIYAAEEDLSDKVFAMRSKKYHDEEYEVVAEVIVPNKISYRYYGNAQFVMGADTFIRETGTNNVMYYAFDMEETKTQDMEQFLADYTQNVQTAYDYESKQTYEEEFDSFRNMLLLMGGVLSFIVGLVGVLNFLNAILTGILARHREFAILQSVGMTGKQLKAMLVMEGLLYTVGSVGAAFALCIVMSPLLSSVLSDMFWFFSYHFTVAPILMIVPVFASLGITLPLVVYHFSAKKSIVERLREAE